MAGTKPRNLIISVNSEWEKLPSVAECRLNMRKKALSDWNKILLAAGFPEGNVEGIKVIDAWHLTRNHKIRGTLEINDIEISVNSTNSDPDEWCYEAHWKDGFWNVLNFIHNLNEDWFVDVLGDPGADVMRFLNVTDACLKHLEKYWLDDKGRSIEQFIEDCLEEHGDGFGPAAWRIKPANPNGNDTQ